MAVRTYKVEKGDTLSGIALKELGDASLYQMLAAINNISNPNLIYENQIIKLEKEKSSTSTGSSSSSSSSTKTTKKKANSKIVTINQFGLQNGSNNLLFAVWTWSKKTNLEHYKYIWQYATGDGHWFIGDEGTTDKKELTYSMPENATKVRFRVNPIPKKVTKNKKKKEAWEHDWCPYKTFYRKNIPPETPSAPTVKINKNQLIVSYDIESSSVAKYAKFEIVKDDKKTVFKSEDLSFKTLHVEKPYTVDLGAEYKARVRLKSSGGEYSEWSPYSANEGTMPSAVSAAPNITVKTETSVLVTWKSVKTADSYEIEYTTEKRFFDTSPDNVSSKTQEAQNGTSIEITGMESGHKYFFRIRALRNNESGGWSPISETILGTKPSAPTTWSSSTTVITGEELNLYWVHNSEDGSSQTKANLEFIVNGKKTEYKMSGSGRFKIDANGTLSTLEPYKDDLTTDADESIKTNSCLIVTSGYSEGVKIQWRVQTAGITGVYGEWSVQRTVDIYARPSLEFVLSDVEGNSINTLTSFPIKISALPGPKTQAPIGYHLSIVAKESYVTVDEIGNEKVVSEGETIYSNYFDINMDLETELSAGDVDFETGVNYVARCVVSMNSGLTAESEQSFMVEWVDGEYQPGAVVIINEDDLSANIQPHCEEVYIYDYPVTYSAGVYTKASEPIDGNVYGEIVEGAVTETGEEVYYGMDDEGNTLYFCTTEESNLIEGVTLSVYRREFDGTFTEIATGIKNSYDVYITDPHPALDYARYRVVAIEESTGAVSYYDVPGEPVPETAIIIQWDEEWKHFETDNADELAEPNWSGNMLRLPYNVDVSDSNKSDVSLIEYIGRRHPVSYYGTQVGQAASWSTEVPITDKETIYQLRRLAIWMGDVYVREPSGSGYWANISVSFSQTHCEMTIPVSLDIVRVEGGI